MNKAKFKLFTECRKLKLEVMKMNSIFADMCRDSLPATMTSEMEEYDDKRFLRQQELNGMYCELIRNGYVEQFYEFMKMMYFHDKGEIKDDVVRMVFDAMFEGMSDEEWQNYIRSL